MWKPKGFGRTCGTFGLLILGALPLNATADGLVAVDFVAEARRTLWAELSVLDGGELTEAIKKAFANGIEVRLILDPRRKATREQGRALLSLAAGHSGAAGRLELRWVPGTGADQRRVLLEGEKLLRWKAGEEPLRDDAAAAVFRHRFEKRWQSAATSLPEGIMLEDDLSDLPDPRDTEPRIVRRKEAAGE